MGFSPMETTPEVMRLFEFVAATSRAHGLPQPKAVRSGGGSDSSNAVVAGVPTVCAMGVKGEGNHAPTEYALVDSLFERCKLLAACILDIGTFEAQGGQA
jgi:glutamate carboxypeptidase